MHWGWYWKVKKKHIAKPLCSWASFVEIDSFKMFKNKECVRLVKESVDRVSFTIPKYSLTATLQDDDSLSVTFQGGSYTIPVEQKPCHYGGFYYFFHCPACKARMRKLYCIQGRYLCRKCAHLGYSTQRLSPYWRCIYMGAKVKAKLENHAGSLEQKPPWMKEHTFQKLRRKYIRYDVRAYAAAKRDVLEWYGVILEDYLPNFDMFDAYVESEETKSIL